MPFAFTTFDCGKVLLPEPACLQRDRDERHSFHKRQDTLDALQAVGIRSSCSGFQPDREDVGMDQAVEETMAVG